MHLVTEQFTDKVGNVMKKRYFWRSKTEHAASPMAMSLSAERPNIRRSPIHDRMFYRVQPVVRLPNGNMQYNPSLSSLHTATQKSHKFH